MKVKVVCLMFVRRHAMLVYGQINEAGSEAGGQSPGLSIIHERAALDLPHVGNVSELKHELWINMKVGPLISTQRWFFLFVCLFFQRGVSCFHMAKNVCPVVRVLHMKQIVTVWKWLTVFFLMKGLHPGLWPETIFSGVQTLILLYSIIPPIHFLTGFILQENKIFFPSERYSFFFSSINQRTHP